MLNGRYLFNPIRRTLFLSKYGAAEYQFQVSLINENIKYIAIPPPHHARTSFRRLGLAVLCINAYFQCRTYS